MNKILAVTGFAALMIGTALAQPAQASWAENSRSDRPVYTGTAQSEWSAERSRRHFSRHAPRVHRGYNAYGYAPGYSVQGPAYTYGPGYRY